MAKGELSRQSERGGVPKWSSRRVEGMLVHLAYSRNDVDTRDPGLATPAKQNVPGSAIASSIYRRGSPGMIATYGRYIPTIPQAIHNSTFIEEALSTSEGQFVEKARHQALRSIQLADGFLCPPVVGILANEAVCADETGNSGPSGIAVSNIF